MKNHLLIILLCILCLPLCVSASDAGTYGGVYDMSRMLAERHPFEKTRFERRLKFKKSIAKSITPTIIIQSSNSPKIKESPTPMLVSKQAKYNENQTITAAFLDELRAGFLIHDEGPFSRNKEDGYDGNFEILFVSPKLLDLIYSPKPHLGGTINSSGNTSQLYAGLTWDWEFFDDYFFNFSLGGAVHNGEKETPDLETKSLGCDFLFRESLDLGYKLKGPHSVTFHLAHISNAKLCSTNEGLETFGIRYGYKF